MQWVTQCQHCKLVWVLCLGAAYIKKNANTKEVFLTLGERDGAPVDSVLFKIIAQGMDVPSMSDNHAMKILNDDYSQMSNSTVLSYDESLPVWRAAQIPSTEENKHVDELMWSVMASPTPAAQAALCEIQKLPQISASRPKARALIANAMGVDIQVCPRIFSTKDKSTALREKKAQAGSYLEGHQCVCVGQTNQHGGETNAVLKTMSAEGSYPFIVAEVRLAAVRLDKMLKDKTIAYGSSVVNVTEKVGNAYHWAVFKAAYKAGLVLPKYAFHNAFYGASQQPDSRATFKCYTKLIVIRTSLPETTLFTKEMHDELRTMAN